MSEHVNKKYFRIALLPTQTGERKYSTGSFSPLVWVVSNVKLPMTKASKEKGKPTKKEESMRRCRKDIRFSISFLLTTCFDTLANKHNMEITQN